MTTRVSTTWVLALVGWAVQAVLLVVLTVDTAHHAATLDPDREAANLVDAVFLSLFGGALYALVAVLAGLAALLLVLVLGLSARAGGRVAALVLGIVVEVPLFAIAVSTLQDGVGVGETVVLAGALLVLVGVVSPSTWRWCRIRTPTSRQHLSPLARNGRPRATQ